jgi:hypothetical protein
LRDRRKNKRKGETKNGEEAVRNYMYYILKEMKKGT